MNVNISSSMRNKMSRMYNAEFDRLSKISLYRKFYDEFLFCNAIFAAIWKEINHGR